jgi:hypothetical protein
MKSKKRRMRIREKPVGRKKGKGKGKKERFLPYQIVKIIRRNNIRYFRMRRK